VPEELAFSSEEAVEPESEGELASQSMEEPVDEVPDIADHEEPPPMSSESEFVDDEPVIPDSDSSYVYDTPQPEVDGDDDLGSSSIADSSNYTSAGMNVDDENDAAFMNELYGAFGKPTSPGSSPFSSPSSSSFGTGSTGTFSADRSNASSRVQVENPDRPSYLATPTPAPQRRTELPPPMPRVDDEREDEDRGIPVGYLAVGGALILAAVGMVVVAGLVMAGGILSGTDDPIAKPIVDQHEGVEVRGNMRQAPKVFGDLDEEPTPPPAEDTDDSDSEQAEGDTDPDLATPDPVPDPRPTVAPPPAPNPRPVPQATPKAVKGTLKIRSNRRVLVYVNGAAVGYTPQDYTVTPGDHTVTAMVPGQPNSKQTIEKRAVASGGVVAVEFTF